jgi:hypothetical protein
MLAHGSDRMNGKDKIPAMEPIRCQTLRRPYFDFVLSEAMPMVGVQRASTT